MKIDGQCHCGYVTYEAEIDAGQVAICHCTDCQMLTGSPYRVTASVARSSIRLTGNAPREYVKIGDNGRKRIQSFCPECGSPLFTTGEGVGAEDCGIRWGSIRQRQQLEPSQQIWCRSAVAWIDQLGIMPADRRFAGDGPEEAVPLRKDG